MKVKILMIAILLIFLNSLNLNCSSRFGDFTLYPQEILMLKIGKDILQE